MLSGRFSSLARTVTSRTPRHFTMQRAMASQLKDFDAAVKAVVKLPEEPSNDIKLKLYGLFKQATMGQNTSRRPSILNIVGRYKWDAWSTYGSMSKAEAESKYVALVNELGGKAEPEAEPAVASDPNEDNSVSGLTMTFADGVATFRFNSPRRMNPISIEMYNTIAAKLREYAKDPKCLAAVLTGTGKYYSSGNDLKNFAQMMAEVDPSAADPLAASAERGREVLLNYQEAVINFPKPMIALVNGPAVGIMVTTLGLCDAVLASDKATFSTPFTNLAQSPEGCSSLIFPLIMGPLVASDVLLFGRTLTAKEAARLGLVSRVIPDDNFASSCSAFIKHVVSLPPGSMMASKGVIRGKSGQPLSRETLLAVSREECRVLADCWQSDECVAAITNFLSRKSGGAKL